jgi:hypothetical protein
MRILGELRSRLEAAGVPYEVPRQNCFNVAALFWLVEPAPRLLLAVYGIGLWLAYDLGS